VCGINLIIDKKVTLDDSIIQKMNESIKHRGPDYSNWTQHQISDQRIYLGNTRLKIIDVHDRANQPMLSTNGQYELTFNGEIYNYKALKSILIDRGYRFQTESDTEVLLNWLIEYGASGIKLLNGMFAFAFVDLVKSQVIIARDRHGMKPLYYTETDAAIVFSSELKGIHASNLVPKKLNEGQLKHYLQFRYTNAPATFFENIKSVTPGYVLTIDNTGMTEDQFSDVAESSDTNEIDVEKVETLLKSAISRHLQADATLGLFLSGGVDSTLLLALSKELGVSLPTFSIEHNATEGSFGTEDSKFAHKAAQQYGASHHTFEVNNTILNGFNEHILHMDQPIGDSASLLTEFLSKKASQKVKTVLSGAGADEWFAGYNRHKAFLYYLRHDKLKGHSKTLKGVANILPTGVDHPFRKPFQLTKKFLENLDTNAQTTYLNFLRFKYFKSDLKGDEIPTDDIFKWALNHDRKHYLVDDILMLGDQWSMRNSIEMRMPFLDNELTSYVTSFDQETLLGNGKKWILKSILNKYSGKEYSQRPKEGFGLPTGKWLHEGHFKEQMNFLNDPQSIIFNYVEKSHITKLVKAHMNKKQDYSLEIWSVMVLANWLKIHFD
jgi:asparagine synthase (glutamine-hydrolysing)